MSSDSSKFSTFVFPSESAARRRQRLERDLDPGSVTVPSSDLMGGTVRVLLDSSTVIGAALIDNDNEGEEDKDGTLTKDGDELLDVDLDLDLDVSVDVPVGWNGKAKAKAPPDDGPFMAKATRSADHDTLMISTRTINYFYSLETLG